MRWGVLAAIDFVPRLIEAIAVAHFGGRPTLRVLQR